MFGFKLKNPKGLARKFQKLGPNFVRRQKIAFMAAAKVVEHAAKARTPKDKGHLHASVRGLMHARGSEISGEVGTNAKHAVYTELGNTPRGGGLIRPKVANLLKFQVRRGRGRVWISKHGVKPIKIGTARSPVRSWRAKRERGASGMQTMPWLQRAFYVKRERVMRLIKDGAVKAIVEAGKGK